jgi:heat-inducible transcriptional repressor
MNTVLVRSIEVVRVANNRALVILITESERIQQHLVIFPADVSEVELALFRTKFNAVSAGKLIVEIPAVLKSVLDSFSPVDKPKAQAFLDGLLLVLQHNRQDKIAFAGATNLVRHEDQFAGGLSSLLETLDQQKDLFAFLSNVESAKPKAIIGSENSVVELANSSLLLSSYQNQGDDLAKVAVVGPTRMNYSKNLAAVLALAHLLSNDSED